MEHLQTIATALGLGFLAGIRLYLTVLALGAGIRYGLIQLPEKLSQLSVLADGRVLAAAAVAVTVEFFADKIPWVDSAWDSLHTFIRPVGAAVLGAATVWQVDPVTQLVVMLLSGGLAFSGHSSKAATRLAVNHSPEPFSNVALSLAGDLAVPAGVWLTFERPEIMLAIIIVFLAVFAWLGPKIVRAVRLEWLAFRSRFLRPPRLVPMAGEVPADLNDNMHRIISHVRSRDVALPDEYAALIERKFGYRPTFGWQAAAAKGVRGLGGSPGYLAIVPGRLVFSTRRLFRRRVHSIDLDAVREARLHRRFLVDELELDLGFRRETFDVFKAGALPARRSQSGPVATME